MSSISSLSSAALEDALTCPASSASAASDPPFFWMRFCSCSGTVAPFLATSYRRGWTSQGERPSGLESIHQVGGGRRGLQQLLDVGAGALERLAHRHPLQRLAPGVQDH